jgi:hypothetical protein
MKCTATSAEWSYDPEAAELAEHLAAKKLKTNAVDSTAQHIQHIWNHPGDSFTQACSQEF